MRPGKKIKSSIYIQDYTSVIVGYEEGLIILYSLETNIFGVKCKVKLPTSSSVKVMHMQDGFLFTGQSNGNLSILKFEKNVLGIYSIVEQRYFKTSLKVSKI